MSKMYQEEVPQYAKLRSLVNQINQTVLNENPELLSAGEVANLRIERHGAIRLGTNRRVINHVSSVCGNGYVSC